MFSMLSSKPFALLWIDLGTVYLHFFLKVQMLRGPTMQSSIALGGLLWKHKGVVSELDQLYAPHKIKCQTWRFYKKSWGGEQQEIVPHVNQKLLSPKKETYSKV